VVRRRVRCHDSAVRTRFLAIGLIAGMLAACTSSKADPDPTPTPPVGTTASSSTVATSPSPSHTGPLTTGPNVRPGEKPPVFPALAKQHTADGALAFAAYYFDAYDWGYATNDPSLVASIAGSNCKGCAKYVQALNSLRARHAVMTGGRITVLSRGLRTGHFNYKSDYVVRVRLDEEPIVIHVPNSQPSTAAPAVQGYVTYLFVSWTQSRWKVVEEAAD
jgi:Family of unknown function (DUF6318)